MASTQTTNSPEGHMHTFNLFKRKEEANLYCAVPVDRPVPVFLTEDKWDYACSLDVESLSGFDAAAARASADANGFYLFHSGA